MTTPERRLAELDLDLPSPAPPVAAYAPTARAGSVVYVSGQLPLVAGELTARGRVGADIGEEEAVACARQCAFNVLAQLRAHAGSLDPLRIVRIGVFVASDPSFSAQHRVADGASELITYIFGQDKPHARFAVGVTALPLGAPVELEATAALLE